MDSGTRQSGLDPKDIFELLPKEIFNELIRGFHYNFRRGVTLFWAVYDRKTGEWYVDQRNRLDPVDYETKEALPHFNKFCWHLWQKAGKERCQQCDRDVAQEFVGGKRVEAGPYTCWAGLGEWAYPLKYGGRVRAVLLAGGLAGGQTIPREEGSYDSIRDALVTKLPNGRRIWNELRSYLAQERSETEDDNTTFQRLNSLGTLLQNIIDTLYDAHRSKFTRMVLHDVSSTLGAADLTTETKWWQDTDAFFRMLAERVGLDGIRIYSRFQSRYRQFIPFDEKNHERETITVRAIIPQLAKGELIDLTGNSQRFVELREALRLSDEHASVYLTRHLAGSIALSTLVVIIGEIPPENRTLVKELCYAVCTRTDVASMVFRLQEAQTKYKLRVGSVAHSFRTPLQAILLDLLELQRLPAIDEDPSLKRRIMDSINRTYDAKDDIQILLQEASEKKVDFDLGDILRDTIHTLESLSRSHGCRLVIMKESTKGLIVYVNVYRISRAILNLIDNAIKYSFNEREIRIWVERQQSDLAKILIQNYGIGIPREKIDQVEGLGSRALVPDRKRRRTGTGWGLPIAKSSIEDHGGNLEIRSYPVGSPYREPGQEYHRFLTEVSVYLPLKSNRGE